MGTLNFKTQKEHLTKIRRVLARRGLTPDLKSEWEIHGPHLPEMNYQVYVGYAASKSEKKRKDFICVAIYPKAVYEIEGPEDWYKPEPENRIYTGE